MTTSLLTVAGGLGLFLVGMVTLTEGLRAMAGERLRRLLARFTRTPVEGVLAGATATALMQSSSATTVIAVGFVGAGLIGFPQALGLILGANIGSTATGWLVAVLGFKLELGLLAAPLLLVGALLRMFGGPATRRVAQGVIGFSLMFLGIAALQSGMAAFEGLVTPDDFPADDTLGRLRLVLIGVAVTLVTQSSGAGVATALAALGAGAISFPQAAAMAIGMDVGTTFKTALAATGGSAAARRTGWAHVIYNALTAAMAFLALDLFAAGAEMLTPGPGVGDPQLALVAFHTLFNTVGVVLILPVVGPFARMIERIVPERGPALTRRLDRALLAEPLAAAEAAEGCARDIAAALREALVGALDPAAPAGADEAALVRAETAIRAARGYLGEIRGGSDAGLATLHALDHLDRMRNRLTQAPRIAALRRDPSLARLSRALRSCVVAAAFGSADAAAPLDRLRQVLRRRREPFRAAALQRAAAGEFGIDEALLRLDAMRWLHRVAYHAWRIAHHLAAPPEGAPRAVAGAESEPVPDVYG